MNRNSILSLLMVSAGIFFQCNVIKGASNGGGTTTSTVSQQSTPWSFENLKNRFWRFWGYEPESERVKTLKEALVKTQLEEKQQAETARQQAAEKREQEEKERTSKQKEKFARLTEETSSLEKKRAEIPVFRGATMAKEAVSKGMGEIFEGLKQGTASMYEGVKKAFWSQINDYSNILTIMINQVKVSWERGMLEVGNKEIREVKAR